MMIYNNRHSGRRCNMNYGLWIIYLSLKLIIYHIFIQFLDKGNIIIWNDKNDKYIFYSILGYILFYFYIVLI